MKTWFFNCLQNFYTTTLITLFQVYIWHHTTKDLNDIGRFDCGRMEEHDHSVMPELKIEIDVAEELPALWMDQKHLLGEYSHAHVCMAQIIGMLAYDL